MADKDITLKTINDLRLDADGRPERYYIAAYQRGYRWSPLQVTQLLDDIREFTLRRNPQPEQFYCLQPIVVRVSEGRGFEIVDGQQRLTTILLILRYFNELLVERRRIPLFVLDYQTRPGLDDFLEGPDQEKAEANIDFSHLYAALLTIETWFDDHENEVERIKDAFLNNTKVIWFQLAASENPVDAFTRLNVGKIPLTNDELIRALFLRRDNDNASASDLQLRIAHEWDQIEKSLQDDSFWYFLTNETGTRQNRIGFLFDLAARLDGMPEGSSSDGYRIFYHFNEKFNEQDSNAEGEWLRLKQVFMMLQDWFEDNTRRLFHIVGFLVHGRLKLDDLAGYSRDLTKDAFEQKLRELVYENVIGDLPDQLNRDNIEGPIKERLETLRYDRHRKAIRSILLLFNIATLLENRKSNVRFQFDSFKKGEWDIEHIRSVSPDDVNTPAKRRDWLTEVRGYLDSQSETRNYLDDTGTHKQLEDSLNNNAVLLNGIDEYLAYDDPKFRVDEFNTLYESVVAHFGEKTEPEPDHGIGNLVLLDANTNRSYKNAVFALKRKRVLSIDQVGIYVPLCTRNVFLKVYSDRVDNAMFWTKEDRDAYVNAITKALTNFFLGVTETVQ